MAIKSEPYIYIIVGDCTNPGHKTLTLRNYDKITDVRPPQVRLGGIRASSCELIAVLRSSSLISTFPSREATKPEVPRQLGES